MIRTVSTYCLIATGLLIGSAGGYAMMAETFQSAYLVQENRKYLLSNTLAPVLVYGILGESNPSGESVALARRNPYDPRKTYTLHIKIPAGTSIRDIASGTELGSSLPPPGTPVSVAVSPENGAVTAQMIFRKM